MDAIRLLKADHKNVEALFGEVESLGDSAAASRKKLFAQIDRELTAHAHVEEEIFYPALKAAAKRDKEAKREVLEAYEEHANVKEMLKKLEATDPKDETYAPKLQVLHELVKHHVKEEEREMFKQARSLLDESELEQLGDDMAQAKERL